jgi:hypothetical protein
LLSASARAAFAQSTSSCRIKVIRIKAAHARRLPHSRTVCTGRWLLAVACHVLHNTCRVRSSASVRRASATAACCSARASRTSSAYLQSRLSHTCTSQPVCPGAAGKPPSGSAAQRSGAKQCHAVRHGTRASHGTSTFCLRALTSARLRPLISPRTARAASRAAAPRPDQRMSHIICALDRLAHISVGTDCGPRPSRARAP